MPNDFGKSIDKTYLSIDMAERRGFIHRDYIAHCLRWSHIIKFLQEKKLYTRACVMDIGCGKEAPLLKTLYSSRLLPHHYMGIDIGPINIFQDIPALVAFTDRILLMHHCNFMDIDENTEYVPDVIVMFEALEHNEKDAGIALLQYILKFMTQQTTFFLSTPCFNGSKAANHVYEWGYDELYSILHGLGFKIRNHWGTFASISDYESELKYVNSFMPKLFEMLRSYYDVNYLATVFAPLFPERSRNVLWQLTL